MLNCQIHFVVHNNLFLQFSMCKKYIFLSITDSLKISYMKSIDILLQLQSLLESQVDIIDD